MPQWQTQAVKQKIEELIVAAQNRIDTLATPVTISVNVPGGDYDTDRIRIEFEDGEWIEVFGFDTENSLTQSDVAEVALLCVKTSPGDSAGGIQSPVEDVCLLAQCIKSTFQRESWDVAGSMDSYF